MTALTVRLFQIATLLVILPALLAPLAQGQSKNKESSARVEGIVRDAQNRPLAHATVSLKVSESGQTLVVQTDSKGHYRFAAIPGGTYELTAKKPGYREASKHAVSLAGNKNAPVDLLLEKEVAAHPGKTAAQPVEYSDDPEFTVAGLTDPTNLGGHGSNVILRTKEELAKETVSLNHGSLESTKAESSAPIDAEKNIRTLLAREDRADLHESLADIVEREGHPLDAVREYQKAAEMEPSEAYLFAWGAELLLHRAPEPAGEVFAKGHRLFPNSARMLQGLGVAFYARGSYDQAVRQLLKACDLDPAAPNSYTFLAKIQDTEKVASRVGST